MFNLSKNIIKLLSTHPVVDIEPIWIISQIFIKSVNFTKLLMTLIDRVYPIHMIILPQQRSNAAASCLLFMIIL